ncbi:HD domain-containing protein [Acinetobacter puyangensis]|uniref:HD domain-containing protein n=1 Tax=Acinetobacter puyangensis TaxID=1096779 RepID=UPI003A4E0F31
MSSLSKANFKNIIESEPSDFKIIAEHFKLFKKNHTQRIIDHLLLLKDDHGGFPVDRLTHCLQTATLAYQDGRDPEYVVCALLHDIGDTLACYNHADLAATLLEPFISEKNYWMLKHHGIFQGYYFFHHIGLDRFQRDRFKDHPYFDYTEEFCRKYDSPAFDQDMETLSLEFFLPMLEQVLATPKKSLYKNI